MDFLIRLILLLTSPFLLLLSEDIYDAKEMYPNESEIFRKEEDFELYE